MAPVVHIIDPNPDTVVVLRNPCTVFAPWNAEGETQECAVSEVSEQPDGWDAWGSTFPTSKKKKKGREGVLSFDLSEPSHPLAYDEPTVDNSMSHLEDGSTVHAEALFGRSRTPSPIVPEEPVEPEEELIHFHVSSRHLMLASPIFKRALTQNGFAESIPNEVDGMHYIEAHDWDIEAFLIVLRVTHGRNKQVPREVSLEMLAKIAVLEDYYNFGEALEVFTEIWIKKLIQAPLPTVYCRNLVLWIWVAWVFDIERRFTEATTTAIRESTDSLLTLDMPIPTIVSDEIDSMRYEAINSVIEELTQRVKLYSRSEYVCPYDINRSFQCGAFLLGGMTKELSRLGLISPRPEVPFSGWSFKTICEIVRDMQSPTWSPAGTRHAHPCTLRAAMATLIEDATSAVRELDLVDLKRTRNN